MEYDLTNAEIRRFQAYLEEEEKSVHTVEKYVRDIKTFMRFLDGKKVIKEQVIGYKQTLIEKGYAVRSVNSMLASLNSLFSFLGWHELRVKSLKIQQEAFCSEDKELTREEYVRLCRTAESENRERISLVLQTICGTGIRVSELPFITVEAVRNGEARAFLKGKTRRIFIVRDLQRKLLSYAREQHLSTGPVFVTESGKEISRVNIWREMKSLCRKANVNPAKVYPHNLRHLFARVFYGGEKDIAKLADILGHSNINTTRIYIVSTGAEHRQRMERMRLII